MPTASVLLTWLIAYRYAVVLPLAIFEGPIVMLTCGFLIRLGFLDLLPAYLLLVAGDFIADLIWYGVGYVGARPVVSRFGRFIKISMPDIERLEAVFRRHDTAIILFSKITMGFGFALATLAAAGAARVPMRVYATLNLVGGLIWTALLLAAGYFLGNLYLTVDEGLRVVFLAAVVVVAFASMYGFSKYMRERIGRSAPPAICTQERSARHGPLNDAGS